MKDQALFSSKDKSKKLLQFLFGALRVSILGDPWLVKIVEEH